MTGLDDKAGPGWCGATLGRLALGPPAFVVVGAIAHILMPAMA
jgi:hypothetical protein